MLCTKSTHISISIESIFLANLFLINSAHFWRCEARMTHLPDTTANFRARWPIEMHCPILWSEAQWLPDKKRAIQPTDMSNMLMLNACKYHQHGGCSYLRKEGKLIDILCVFRTPSPKNQVPFFFCLPPDFFEYMSGVWFFLDGPAFKTSTLCW